jgi:hypothetical protein
VKIQIT